MKFSQIKAWLDDRGKEYEKDGNLLKAYKGIKIKSHIKIVYLNGEYLVGLNRYSSQKEVINKEINAFYHNEYKEMK